MFGLAARDVLGVSRVNAAEKTRGGEEKEDCGPNDSRRAADEDMLGQPGYKM